MFAIKRLRFILLVASAVLLAAGIGPQSLQPALASPAPQAGVTIPYAGRLDKTTGESVPGGAYDFTFAIYNAKEGGEPFWSEMQSGVEVRGGAFATLLGAAIPIQQQVLDGQSMWLAVSVRGPGEVGFTLLTPRQQLSTEALTSPASPGAGLSCAHTHFAETWTGSSTTWGLKVVNTGTGGGLYGRSAKNFGVYGSSDSYWSGVFDNGILVTHSPWHGIEIDSTAWAGVWVKSAGYAGVEANGNKGDGVLGVTKDTDTNGKAGAHGVATGGWYYGVLGQDGSGTDMGYGLRTRGYPGFGAANGDARINDDLSVDGTCTGCATAYMAQNTGDSALTPGDVVVVGGLGEISPLLTGQRPLLVAEKQAVATLGTSILGVVLEGAPPKADTGIANNGTTSAYIPSGGYMVIATPGQMARLKVEASAETIHVGDPLTAAPIAGLAKKATTVTVEGVTLYAADSVLGRALEPVQKGSTEIWVLLTFR